MKKIFDPKILYKYIDNIYDKKYNIDIDNFKKKVIKDIEEKKISINKIIDYIILEAELNISVNYPNWEKFTASLYLNKLYKQASKNRYYNSKEKYGSYIYLYKKLEKLGIYSDDIIKNYSENEIIEASKIIDSEKDKLFTYNGLSLLAKRYLAKDNKLNIYELPQERWLTIALYIMQKEKKNNRMKLIKEVYWALSNLYMTVATPTLANAGKKIKQLSSCFIDTIDDSLQGIYDSNTDIARVSKHGGGIGAYIGFVRSTGSNIRGVKGSSGGVIPWIKQLNNTAVSVDQLGQRKGAITVYLDIFHKDIEMFLDLRLNNGDQRLRAHDIFTAVCIPDIFMEAVENRDNWYIFDPYEIKIKKGWYLQDFYDEFYYKGTFREKYYEIISDETINKKKVKAIDIFKRIMISQLETGTPFMFYRDEINRKNPNKHIGMIYGSNLCTEIVQNMSSTKLIKEIINEDKILITKLAGDFVVCNLSSINLGKVIFSTNNFIKESILKRLIKIQVRMLDNIIDINVLPVPQAEITNKKYRAIGLGTLGWHQLLAENNIHWDSKESEFLADKLYEYINYLTIKNSQKLAKEKGAYKVFYGSDWQTGEYFKLRNYNSKKWCLLAKEVALHGIRNAYLMAIAPNMSTSQITGSTASIDPIYDIFYYDEKKDYRRIIIAPNISKKTLLFYKGAFKVDQFASIRQNACRQRHIDQSISFNFYVYSNIYAKNLLELHLNAWKNKLKTTYYVRTNSNVEECNFCSS